MGVEDEGADGRLQGRAQFGRMFGRRLAHPTQLCKERVDG